MNNKQNKTKQNTPISVKQGFSLIETMISVFIFSLIAVLLAGAFSGFLKNVVTSKKAQRSAENAQYVMNLIAKTMRSSTMNPASFATAGQITMFDNSQAKCLIYKRVGNVIQIGKANSVSSDLAGCIFATIALNDLTPTVSGSGDVIGFAGVDLGGAKKKVLLSIRVAGPDAANPTVNSTFIQTSISLR